MRILIKHLQKNEKKTNYLRRIASYLLIFAILSNLSYIPCYFYMRHINRNTAIAHYKKEMESGMQMFDAAIESVIYFHTSISKSNVYKAVYYYDADVNTLNNLRQIIPVYTTLPYSFISNFGLIQNKELLFSNGQIYYKKDYLSSDYYFSCADEDYFEEFTDPYCFLPAKQFRYSPVGEYEAVTLGYRWSSRKNMYFFVHFPVEELLTLFVEKDVIQNSNIAVYYGDTLLASAENLLDGQSEKMTVFSDSGMNLRVELQLAESFIERDLAGFKKLVQIFLVIILVAVGLWVLFFSKKMADPFNRIGKILQEADHSYPSAMKDNSIDTMIDSIRKIGIQLSEYDQLIKVQKENNRNNLMEKALYRGLLDQDSKCAFKEAFPDFPEKWQLAFIQYSTENPVLESEPLQLFLTHYIQKKRTDAILFSYSQDMLLAFLPVSEQESAQNELETIGKEIETQYAVLISISIGKIYDSYEQLTEAFQDLEYESMRTPQTLSLTEQKKRVPISMKEVQTIYLALANGDGAAAVSVLQNNFEGGSHNVYHDLAVTKYVYRMIQNTLVLIKLENDIIDVALPNFETDKIQELFEQKLPDCFLQLAEKIDQKNASKMEDLDYNILQFIDENMKNPQLCVAMVTDYFHISAPTLQKRMNHCSGKTFSGYVEDLRMDTAHQLLQDTELAVQDIAERVGYANGNTFYKAYKRYFGEAPLTTRKNGAV